MRIASILRVPIAFFLTSGAVHSQPDCREILSQVAAACRKLYTGGYIVEIRRHQVMHPRINTGSAAAQNDRFALPLPHVTGRTTGAKDRITISRLGHDLRYDLENSSQTRFQWTTDGQTVWCYRRDQNAYTEEKITWPAVIGPGPGLPGMEWHYFTRFLAIDRMADRARFVKDDIAPDATCPGPSMIVELDLGLEDEPGMVRLDGKEDLRILTETHLPCQATSHRVYLMRDTHSTHDVTEIIEWSFRAGSPDQGLFVFTPPKNAHRVKRFRRTL